MSFLAAYNKDGSCRLNTMSVHDRALIDEKRAIHERELRDQAKTKLENNLILNQLFYKSMHVKELDKHRASQSQPDLASLG